ncbi:MAG: aldehyde dehydrogenase family protein, partial [Acidobacteria bacterium]|nr:aldehyde dehydrogenase family protein [Acidobacteriota bacterium]
MATQTIDPQAPAHDAQAETNDAQTPTNARGEIVSYDPATNEEIGRVPVGTSEEVRRAVARAREAQAGWAARSYAERGRVILRAREIVLDELDAVAELIARESGKPVTEAISMELVPTLDLMRYFARETGRLLRAEKINIGQYGLLGRTSRVVYRPVGVVAVISPWNFPWAIPVGEVVMALAAGNAVVLKPSELTPFVGLKIADVFARAGLPEGLLAVLTGDGGTGAALVEAGADKIMFTGSVATGRRVAEVAGRNLTPCVLELGGKDPMIVFADADADAAAAAAVWGAFANSGQACASVERCYVEESIAEEFTARVVELTRALRQDAG